MEIQPQLKIDIISLFPGMVEGFLSESILGRAQKNGILQIRTHNLRDWSEGPHNQTDDRPFGGGAGMVLKPEPVFAAIEALKTAESKVIYLAPDGVQMKTSVSQELASEKHLILLSGHYEGIDQRIRDNLVDIEISIGDYVLTNGTLAAAVVIDAVCRYVPNVLGEQQSLEQDAFSDKLLSFPQYTRPAEFRGLEVPLVLLSGDHQAIASWRREQQYQKTERLRPDLLLKGKIA